MGVPNLDYENVERVDFGVNIRQGVDPTYFLVWGRPVRLQGLDLIFYEEKKLLFVTEILMFLMLLLPDMVT